MFSSVKNRFEKFSIKDGLSNSSVSCIIQDFDGFMWFGTFNGVSKYDGYKFKNYTFFTNPINVLDSNVTSCFLDSEKKLWLGTANGHILEFNKEKDQFQKYKLNIQAKCFITSITEDRFGYLWISTIENGLFKFDKKSKESYCLNIYTDVELLSLSIYTIINKNDDELIIGSSKNGIYIFNVLNETFENISLKTDEDINNISIRSIHEYNKEKFIVLTNSKLKILDVKSRNIFDIKLEPNNELDNLNFFKSFYFNDKILIGLFKGGLLEIDLNSKKVEDNSENTELTNKIGNDRVISFYKDKSEVMWIGTMGLGVFKINLIRKRFYYVNKLFDKEKDLNLVFDLKIDRSDNLWIGSFSNGLYKTSIFSPETIKNNTIILRNHFLNNHMITNIFEDINNNLWIGTKSNGLFKFFNDKSCFEEIVSENDLSFKSILSISEYISESVHYLLLGTDRKGILCVNTETHEFKEFTEIYKSETKIITDSVSKMYKDTNNNLWLSLSDFMGIFKISLDDYSKKNYFTFEFGQIYEDRNNNVWIGSSSGLIKHDDKTGLNYCYNTNQGIEHNRIYGILEDNGGNMWVTTRETISKFDISSETFRNYEYKDGPLNEEFWIACCKDKNGTLYFGGLYGIDYFNPKEIVDNPHIPNIVITEFQIFNESITASNNNSFLTKSITVAKEINLSHKENIFSFEFAALIFNSPKQNQYAYKMEGFDKDWVYCGTRRTATYTNLDPGEYVFRVKGSNNDGIWNEEGTSIKITITPPYWKTWWFKGLGLMSLFASAGYYYKQKLEKLEYDSKIQIDFSRKLIDTQENEKKRIAHELHDTIAHEVLISKNKALMALKHKSDVNRMEKTLEEISELSSSTITDVRNIAYNLHPHQLERLGFTKTIKSIINEASGSTNINFMFESDDVDEVLSKESEINLFRVIQESISNIIKHSKATEVILKVSKSKETLSVLIVDNGKGFDVRSKAFEETKHGFGLSGISERIKFLKGEIKIDSEINKGTTLKFKIPIKKSYG